MKDDFLTHIAHDLRTLVSTIHACTDLLEASGDGGKQTGYLVKTIRENSQHLLSLITNALDLWRIEDGKLPIKSAECDPGQTVTDIVATLQPLAIRKRLKLEAVCDGPIPKTIHTDAIRLRQVLLNLVDNAIKFTREGGVRIAIASAPAEADGVGWLSIGVADTGIGISGQSLERIFDPFVQAEESVTYSRGGTGLGLTIAKQLTELLGGTLAVRSQPGKGTTFTLKVPTGVVAESAFVDSLPQLMLGDDRGGLSDLSLKRRHQAGEQNGRLRGVNVLLIEDRPDMRLLLSVILKSAGGSVQLSGSGEPLADLFGTTSACRFHAALLGTQTLHSDPGALIRSLRTQGYTGSVITLVDEPPHADAAPSGEAGSNQWVTVSTDTGVLAADVIRAVAAGCGCA